MPRRRAPLPDRLRDRPFTVAHARAHGVTPGRLTADDLHHPTAGVRSTVPLLSTLDRARAYGLVMPDDAMYSHQTSADLLQLPMPSRLRGGPLHISTRSSGPVVRRKGVVGHRGSEGKRRLLVHGLPVAAPEDTLIDLAPVLDVDALVQLGDAILARAPEYTEHVAEAVVRRRGARGMRRVRAAMELMRLGSASPMETVCRLRMMRYGLPAPLLNHDIYDEHGQWIACVDFCWPARRVVVEYDGEVHSDPAQRKADATRRRQLTLAGWTVVVLTSADVLRSDNWLADVRALLS